MSFQVILPLCRYMALIKGKDSTVTRQMIVYNLLKMCNNGSQMMFITRFLEGNLGIGVREKTIISSLARAIAFTPPGVFPQVIRREFENDIEKEKYIQKIEGNLLEIFNGFSH